ncbi:MAG: response regulator [Ginsengibacter sp.]
MPVKQKCILIYDDDKEISILCKMILQNQNYKVESRATCDNIINDIKTMNPSLILMDLWIPTVGGEKSLKLIRENPVSKNLPVLFFSANDDIEKISKRAGASGYVRKPFDITSFKEIINSWI